MNTVLMSLELVADFLSTVAAATATFINPVVGEVLNAGAALIRSGDAAATDLQTFTQQIRAMHNAGRDPTEDEWNALKARSDAAHSVIQNTAPSADS